MGCVTQHKIKMTPERSSYQVRLGLCHSIKKHTKIRTVIENQEEHQEDLGCGKREIWFEVIFFHNTLTPERNTKTWAVSQHIDTPRLRPERRTPRLGLCHNTLTPERNTKTWAVSQHIDSRKKEHQGLGCVTKTWAVSQHIDSRKNTKAWAVSQHIDSRKKYQDLGCVTTH